MVIALTGILQRALLTRLSRFGAHLATNLHWRRPWSDINDGFGMLRSVRIALTWSRRRPITLPDYGSSVQAKLYDSTMDTSRLSSPVP